MTDRVEKHVIEGVVVTPTTSDGTPLAQAFIEGTTEYDYADLPPRLRGNLEHWCDLFRAWAATHPKEYMLSHAPSARYGVPCPTCHAAPDQPCRARTSRRVTDTHSARIQAWVLGTRDQGNV